MDDIVDILKETVSAVAPVLANAILPGSGGLAASLLARALGTTPDPQSLAGAMAMATPEQIVEIKRLELENSAELTRISVEIDKDYLLDRQTARARDIEFIKSGLINSRSNWMIAGDVVGLMVCLAALIFLPSDSPGEARGMLATFASYFGLGLRDAHQFEFGSSRGSKEKDAK